MCISNSVILLKPSISCITLIVPHISYDAIVDPLSSFYVFYRHRSPVYDDVILVCSLRSTPLFSLITDWSYLLFSLYSDILPLLRSSLSKKLFSIHSYRLLSSHCTPLCLVFIHPPSLHFNHICSFPSDLSSTIYLLHIQYAPLISLHL